MLHILSLGAGVQSSTMLLMALHGELTPMPDAVIFADTGAEPAGVYDWLDYLETEINGRFPIYRVEAGNIEADTLAGIDSGKRIATAPFYAINLKNPLPDMPPVSGGMLFRKCTSEYKLYPIRRKLRELWRDAGKPKVVQWIGISWDELSRIKRSGVKYITNIYPLCDRDENFAELGQHERMTRQDCLNWLKSHGYPEPPKSACFFCPYTSNSRWQHMKKNDPETFARACEFDAKLRSGKLPKVTGEAYVHRSFIPLSDVKFRDEAQMDFQFGFDNECEGMCGV